MSDAIVKAEQSGIAEQWRKATDVAGAVREFALKRCATIQGKKYPTVEVWQAVANAYGLSASARDVEMVPGGVRAIGEVRRLSDGVVVASGEGFVGDDEPTWAKRPMFARRAMAQTRGISRACRSALAFVIPLIDAGLSTTPAEEMEYVDSVASPVAQRQDDLKAKLAASVALVNKHLGQATSSTATVAPRPVPRPQGNAPVALPNYGKHKGEEIATADVATLEFYANGARRSLADESKAKWHAREQALLDALLAELASRNTGDSQEPPPHTDEDAP